jgi:hypothetical protein
MADKVYPNSQLPIRKSSELLPETFRTDANDKFLSGVVDPLIQPGALDKLSGYVGRRFGKTYNGNSVYLDTDNTLRSRYQLEPGVTVENNQVVTKFYDYLDFKNIETFFGNSNERDDKTTFQEHYSWNPPIDWDKFINYREYYWVPAGPPTVAIIGQTQDIQSTYKVNQGIGSSWVFTPDGLTNNPTLTLYRGQTYKFTINSPGEPFVLRTNYDTGSLNFDPLITYFPGDLAAFDGKLWRAKEEVSPADGSSIDLDSQDWELVDSNASFNSLIYNSGVTNNSIEVGTLTFTVPLNSPDVLFYQSETDPNRLGRFIIADIESNTAINVEKEILGKTYYKSANGVELSNGMVVEFRGQVESEKYATDTWLVEGIGKEITLIRFADLIPPNISANTPEILFDNEGFDSQPFDDATLYPANKDYITINRSSNDSNPWSRYNRWFHRSVLEYAFNYRDSDFDGLETARAKRPIIEFHPGIKLYQQGTIAKASVDYIDDYTKDVFSTIEGSTGYSVDGEFLFEGARVLVTADDDNLANNKIYEVKFIVHNGTRQITLQETTDSKPTINECVLASRGTSNSGKQFYFDGTSWKKSQEKTTVNQAPLFDSFNETGVALDNLNTYPVSSFAGSKIFSYKQGNGPVDNELGMSISYQNIDNVGDIEFDWSWETEQFRYTINQQAIIDNINKHYYQVNGKYENGWVRTQSKYLQPIVDSVTIIDATNIVQTDIVDFDNIDDTVEIIFFRNGDELKESYTRNRNQFTFTTVFQPNDIITIKVVGEIIPNNGYYEIPVGLEKNPLNETLKTFTLGQAADHVKTALEFDTRFTGVLPGVSNLRDISDFTVNAKRFLKHSGVAASALLMLADKEINIVKSLQYAKKQYSLFKENFIKKSFEVDDTSIIPDLVDSIFEQLTKTKSSSSPFADSDTLGTGAFTKLTYTVDDPGLKTFTLNDTFDLDTLSRRAVYVYKNNTQLLHGKDYTFSSEFAFLTILGNLIQGDHIEIREYVSTASCHVPPTPTSIGLYKKYTPMKFIDDTYRVPTEVIQGHDGSITVAYGDFRDDVLLELEYRIYNNIKQSYEPSVFDIDANLGGYYKNSVFTKAEFDAIASQEFLKWVANTNLGYTANTYLKDTEPFTYTYSNMTTPDGDENLPGWWRGVYNYFYDTDRPHRCPWEMLGFSEKPSWWDTQYGEAPYTSGNLILWEDIRDGIIRKGERAGTYKRYARTSILRHIPVNEYGELLSPLDSGLATNYTLTNNKGSFTLGDVSPTEYAYRSSSEFPFVVTMALCLLRPFEYIVANFDRSKTKRNIADQIISKSTGIFIKPNEIILPVTGSNDITSGLAFYIGSYLLSSGKPIATAQSLLSDINVRLTSRLNGFVDKTQQKYLLDSKSPAAASSSIFIPEENYNIFFNVSSPIQTVSYSGIIFEKTEGGWIVNGYDDVHPYFRIYKSIPNQADPTLSVGGVSATFVNWTEDQLYNNGAIAQYRSMFYRAKLTHTSTDKFETDNWTKLPELPIIGAATAQRRRNFNQFATEDISYGTTFNTVQQVVDFLLGYEHYLKSQGFVFENYSTDNQAMQDFTTAAKEFMFWTRNEWAVGSLLTVSPGAERLKVTVPIGVVDNILDSFYDYNVLTDNGEPMEIQNFDVNREFQTFTFTINETTRGLFYLKLNYVLKEHVAIFNDRTVFNDVIFDKPTGYRQERIKVQGFRTVDWDGDYTSPGFLFDNVNIASWQPFTDYKLGDIINYQGVNYTSKRNHTSDEEFNAINWTVLDSTPEKKLVPNFDFKINQMEDYFDVDTEGLSESQRELARHTIGYQTRDYLQNLSEDSVTQFRLYQGFIREKGTNNAFTKIFNKLGRTDSEGVNLKEEWAFKVGQLGGTDQTKVVEIKLDTDNFVLNPQPLLVTDTKNVAELDRYYRINQSDFYFAPIPFATKINPTTVEKQYLRTAGYVKVDQTKYVVQTRDDIVNIDMSGVLNNDHIWVTFDDHDWTVLRVNFANELPISNITTDKNKVTVTFTKRHNLNADDFIGFKTFGDIDGFHKITEVTNFTISFETTTPPADIDFEPSTLTYPILLTNARFASYDTLDLEQTALLDRTSKLYIDNNGSNKWEVVEKRKQFSSKKITAYGSTDPKHTGKKVLYLESLNQTIASMPGSGITVVYVETSDGLAVKQLLQLSTGFTTAVTNTYGEELATTPDNKWLIVGSPNASGVPSNYQGMFSTYKNYSANDIVLYEGQLWKAKNTIIGDGSSINVYTEDWEQTFNINALESGSNEGYGNQGMISLYSYSAQQWNYVESFVSPRADGDKFFGSKITVAQTATGYTMAVSAPGLNDTKGRVYLYNYTTAGGWELIQNKDYRGIYQPGGTLTATEILAGRTYTIETLGTTDFQSLGALTNTPGLEFVSTGRGDGTGTVSVESYYPKGSIVFYNGNLWKALEDNQGDGSTISIESNDWIKLDSVNTNVSLPSSVSIEDDGSTLASGILSADQLAELIKEGDKFGSSLAFNNDGTTLIIGAVEADGQYFQNYKGNWQPNYEYMENDVVKYQGGYHKLENLGATAVGPDSTIRSYNQAPDDGYPWVNVGDSSTESVGKVFVYTKNSVGFYSLQQTITAESLAEISDLPAEEIISTGDMFGYAVDMDMSGTTLVITSPKADKNFQNQGSAYIFKYESDSSASRYRLKQKIESYGIYPNEYFGQSVCMTSNAAQVVIGANNTGYNLPIRFDTSSTTFDELNTSFTTYGGYSGAVYVFKLKGTRYLLTEKLEDDLSTNESFGYSVSCSNNIIAVGSPKYIAPVVHGPTLDFTGPEAGMVRLFRKDPNVNSLEIIGSEPDKIDLSRIKRISLYKDNGDTKIQDLEVVDPAKLKVLAAAEKELTYKTLYDPATYNIGTEDVVVDDTIAWFGKNVGKLWWNVSTAKWLDYEQADIAYRSANWGAQVQGSSIDVYEWVESKLLPSEWSVLADTNEGLQLGVSGQPLYADDTVYSVKEFLNVNTGLVTETKYYFWVKNKVTVPENILGRQISAGEVASLINNPSTLGNTYIALADADKIFFYNYKNIVSDNISILNLEYYNTGSNNNVAHKEFLLLTEGDENSVPNSKLEKKWIDSLVGYDIQGNRVPDTNLPAKQKYGLSFRPRQSMFVNRKQILKQTVESVNAILVKEAFANTIDFTNLNLVDPQPAEVLYLYDVKVDSIVDLENVGTVRVKQAKLSANIVDNEITSINIVDPGFGYKPQQLFSTEAPGVYPGPAVVLQGDGVGAEVVTHIDNQGRIVQAVVVNSGKNYTYVNPVVRQFSVLVVSDSTAANYWSIYAWDDIRKTFYRSASQAFDTKKYWTYIDWWKTGYSETTRVTKEILDTSEEPSIQVAVGDLIRIKEYGSGSWAVFKKETDTSDLPLGNYTLVGRRQGTIKLSENLYNLQVSGIGYDNTVNFDTGLYDLEPTVELRNVFTAIKDNIFIGDNKVEWNKTFFNSIRYVLHEQVYVDWLFKTSFLKATHNVGNLKVVPNYSNDNLESFQKYIEEVKPYRTTIREYVSKYNQLEGNGVAANDFDLPAVYSSNDGKIVTVNENSQLVTQEPWKTWFDNKGYSITDIVIANGGSGYTSPPNVVIEGNGTGASAQAFVSSGKVTGVRILNKGKGYTSTPTVNLVGGNGASTYDAVAVAYLGEGTTRSFELKVKFDRIAKEGLFTTFTDSQTFTATGSTSVFDLKYAPTIDKTKISITKNNQTVLGSDYTVSVFTKKVDGYSFIHGRIILNVAPQIGDVIKINYSKNDELLDSVNRINKYYNPTDGMKGKELNQLMTGIDYGGVQIQGTTFDVTGGWDALPWFSDSWDSVESSADYYVVADGSTNEITLPYIPADGKEINIYLKRAGEGSLPTIDNLQYGESVKNPPVIRIDDPNFGVDDDSSSMTNKNAVMPTFIGDGSTTTIEIGAYVTTNDGDILIFRPIDSDGAVTITDPNIVDTNLTGGSLSAIDGAYATATGLTVEEIKITGGQYIGPDQVPSPEENIPGQVLDNLSIKVFQTTNNGAAPLESNIFTGDGSTTIYEIGQDIIEDTSLLVYVDGIKQVLNTDYTATNTTVEFTTPVADKKIEIISIGIGGVGLLDYQEFTADGATGLYLTDAPYSLTSNIFVTVDGVAKDAVFSDSTDTVDTVGRSLVEFGQIPAKNSIIKIVAFQASENIDSGQLGLVRVNRQTTTLTSDKTVDLDNFVQLTRESSVSSMVVEINNIKLKGPDTVYSVYDGVTNSFTLGQDPIEASGAILSANIKVYINSELKTFIQDYVYDGTSKLLTINTDSLNAGDVIKIENDLRAEFSISANRIVIDDSVSYNPGDILEVTWFSEYPSMEIYSDRNTGGKVNYELPYAPLGISYVWVYKNGVRLVRDTDYTISLPRGVVYLEVDSDENDTITITTFGADIYKLPSSYEISKDMLNVYRYNRYATDSKITLTSDLNYYDDKIELTDGSNLYNPVRNRNIAGVIEIRGERIEYLNKTGNTISQLRRGVNGTAIKELHAAGSSVADIGPNEVIPYTDSQERTDFVSDGSSSLIGPLEFVPTKSAVGTWTATTIPTDYGRCDTVEVFVGGTRLRKTPLTVYDESLGPVSPGADKELEAEFAADGVNPYIRLTTAPAAGTRITVIKRTGNTWYDKGLTTASNGVTLLDNNTAISKFIAAKTTSLPE